MADNAENMSLISACIAKSANPEMLKEIFSDHFNGINEPVSVSLGLTLNNQRVDDVVKMLRSEGIEATAYYDPLVKDNMNCFVVDGTGVRSPVLAPQDAIKATADLFEIMQKNNIDTSRAYPVSHKNLIPAIAHNYQNNIIDVVANNSNQQDVKNFLTDMINKAATRMQPVDITKPQDTNETTPLYRGGTLGDKPYALTFHRRWRDAAYATKDFAEAVSYADGYKGAGLRYDKIDNHPYGFIYQFTESPGQHYYGMAGAENPRGSEECVNHPDNKPNYETMILPERNALKNIYLKVNDKVVKIADENGYISPEWERFAKLHTPYNNNEKNDYMAARKNKLIAEFPCVPYERKELSPECPVRPQIKGLVFSQDLKKNETGQYEVKDASFIGVSVPEDAGKILFTGNFIMGNSSLPQTGVLNLECCSGIVGIYNSEIAQSDRIAFPKQCKTFFLSNAAVQKGTVLDLSHIKCDNLTLENMDLSQLKDVKFPEAAKEIKLKGRTKLAEQQAVLDLSNLKCETLILENQDLSQFKYVKFPENTEVIRKGNTRLPKQQENFEFNKQKIQSIRNRLAPEAPTATETNTPQKQQMITNPLAQMQKRVSKINS